MGNQIIEQMTQMKDALPKKQRQLCEYIIIHHEKVSMMTVSELASHAGTGTTTVMRFIELLGYDSFSEFKRELLAISLQKNTSSYHRMKEQFKNISAIDKQDVFKSLLDDTGLTLDNLINPLNIQNLESATDLMVAASSINVLGLRISKVPALYLENMLDKFFQKVKLLSYQTEYGFDNAYRLTPDDTLVVFSIWPCTKLTIELADVAHSRNVPIILVTNTNLNPIANFADIIINTDSVNSHCGILPAMFVAEAMINSIAKKSPSEALKQLDTLESSLDKHNLFIWERNNYKRKDSK